MIKGELSDESTCCPLDGASGLEPVDLGLLRGSMVCVPTPCKRHNQQRESYDNDELLHCGSLPRLVCVPVE
jgi:hypothetical protein